jgi:hypothetical protein
MSKVRALQSFPFEPAGEARQEVAPGDILDIADASVIHAMVLSGLVTCVSVKDPDAAKAKRPAHKRASRSRRAAAPKSKPTLPPAPAADPAA